MGFMGMKDGYNASGYREVGARSLVHSGFDLARMVASMEDNIVMGMWGEVDLFDVSVEVVMLEREDGGSEVAVDVVGRLWRDEGSRQRWKRRREYESGELENYIMGMARVLRWRKGECEL